jgi:hypothetical protein
MSLPQPEPHAGPQRDPSSGDETRPVPPSHADGAGGSPTVSQRAALAAWREEVRAHGERHRAAQARRFSLRALLMLVSLACVASAALGFLVQWAAHALGHLHSARQTLDAIEAEAVKVLRQGVPTRQPPPAPGGVRVYSDPPREDPTSRPPMGGG